MSIAPSPAPMTVSTDQGLGDVGPTPSTPEVSGDQDQARSGSKDSCVIVDSAIAPPEDAALRMPLSDATPQPSAYRYDSGPNNMGGGAAEPVPLKRRILHNKASHDSLSASNQNSAAIPMRSSPEQSSDPVMPAPSLDDDMPEPMPLSKIKDKCKSVSQPVLAGSGPFTSVDVLNAVHDRSATTPASPPGDTANGAGVGTAFSMIDLAVRTMAAIRIQNWWRLTSMQQHFRRLKRRESGSAGDSSILMQSRHSRAESTTADPLLACNDEYLDKFNHGEPKPVLHAMRSGPLCDGFDTDALAHLVSFFTRNRGKLDRIRMGELFGHPDPLCVTLMRAYINSLEFTGMDFVRALRTLLTHFRLPGEAQKIDRILDQFSVAYHATNPGVFKDAGTAFVLSFSLIMLNTDAHNPAVKRKMSVTDFVRNNRGIDAGGDLPAPLLRRLYYEIVCHEIAMDNDESGRTAKVLRGLLGAEKVRSAYLGQYSASKVIRGAKHERRLFLFGSHLLIAKQKVPKHQVSQLFELNSITLSKYADDDQDAPFPNTVAVQLSTPSGTGSESNTSPGSAYSSDPSLVQTSGDMDHLQLVFESPEERDVFVSNVLQAMQAYLRELESIEKYISDRVALTKANLERRYRSLTAAPVMDHPTPTIDNSSAYTSPEGTLAPNRPSSAAPTTTATVSVTPAAPSPSPNAAPAGSLRAKRMAMQRDAARTAQTLQQTRSMLQSRASSAAVSGRSSLQGSAQNLLADGQSTASVPMAASSTTANSPTTTSPKFGSAGSVNDDDPTAGGSQTPTTTQRGRPATASAAIGSTRRGSTASSIFRMSRSPSPAIVGLAPGTANIPRSPSANGYFLSLPSRIIGTLSRRNRVGSARGANNLGNQDDEVGSPSDDDDASSIASGGAAEQAQQQQQAQQPVFRTRYGSQKGLTMEETIPEMSSRRESTVACEDRPVPQLGMDSESRDTLSTTRSSSPPPESANASGSLWGGGRRRAASEARRGTIA